MKSWLYYFIGAAALSGVVVFWKYRYKFLKGKYDKLQIDFEYMKNLKRLNKKANERKQEADRLRNEKFKNTDDSVDGDDPWAELRKR